MCKLNLLILRGSLSAQLKLTNLSLIFAFFCNDRTCSRWAVNKRLPNIFCKLLHKSLVVKIEMYFSIKYSAASANFSLNVTSLQSKNSIRFLRPETLIENPPNRKQWAFTLAAQRLGIVYSKHLMRLYTRAAEEIARERNCMWLTTVQLILPHTASLHSHPLDRVTRMLKSSYSTGFETLHF